MRKGQTLLIAGLMVILFSVTGWSQQDAGCTENKCHADMGTKQFVHGPVGAKICTICHTEVQGKKHQFEYTTDKEELCFACHEEKRDMMLEDYLHTPVADGNCVGCHDPHQADYRFQLKGNASELCFTCHKKDQFMQEFVHGPVGVGDCNVCHNPHSSSNEMQLVSSPDKICYNCHIEQSDIPTKRHIHEPAKEKCTTCHDPHSDKAKFLLPNDPPELCYGCHDDFEEYSNAAFQHDPVVNGKCTNCHNPHASDNPRMFAVPQEELCFSCHEELSSYVSENSHKHGPVKQGDCNACHDPHGSENYKILRKYFPEEFYMPYETENYAICFDCHNSTIALDAKTMTLTDFRDGDINLHNLHVNKEVKGRSCKACHQAHATNQDKHIRESVPFGSMNWELPIKFTKLDDGGSCVVGCHAPKEYHR